MSDFKYDYDQDGMEGDESVEDRKEQEKALKLQKQFKANYELMMKEQEGPSSRDDKNISRPEESKKPDKKEPKKEEPAVKKPPMPPAPENNKAKLIEQHIKLKNQLKELAVKMDEILVKERERRRRKANPVNEEDERVKEIRAELKEQELEIQKNKALIQQLRKNLDNKYDINKIVQKENDLKHLKKQLEALEKQKASLERIRGLQDKALKMSEDEETKRKYERMKEDLAELTQKNRKYVESINQKQKQLRRLHQNYIVKDQKIKQIEAKLKQKDKKPNASGLNNQDINEYTISQLEDTIKQLEKERQQVEKDGNDRIRQLEKQKRDLKQEVERKKIILEEKEKDLRLNQIKYRDIVRLINSVAHEPKKQSNQYQNSEQNKDDVDSKASGKRVLDKKGRAPPKMDLKEEEPIPKKDQHLVDKIDYQQKHQVGVGGNLDEYTANQHSYDEYAEDFQADEDIVAAEKKAQQNKNSPSRDQKEIRQDKPNVFTKPALSKKS